MLTAYWATKADVCRHLPIHRVFSTLLSFVGLLHDLLSFCGASLTSRGQELLCTVYWKARKSKHPIFLLLGSGPWPVTRLTLALKQSSAMNMDQKQHHGTPWWHQLVITGYIHLNQIYPPLAPPNCHLFHFLSAFIEQWMLREEMASSQFKRVKTLPEHQVWGNPQNRHYSV